MKSSFTDDPQLRRQTDPTLAPHPGHPRVSRICEQYVRIAGEPSIDHCEVQRIILPNSLRREAWYVSYWNHGNAIDDAKSTVLLDIIVLISLPFLCHWQELVRSLTVLGEPFRRLCDGLID